MSGSTDLLAQTLLAQSRQSRRPSAQAQLAAQMMQQANQGGPVWGTGATVARAIPGVVAAWLAQRAETSDRNQENEDFKRNAQYQAQREARQQAEFEQFAQRLGLAGGTPQQAPAPPAAQPDMPASAPMAAPQPAPVPADDGGALAASAQRYAAVPGRPAEGSSFREPEWAAGLAPANGRMANLGGGVAPSTPVAGLLAARPAPAAGGPSPSQVMPSNSMAAALLAAASPNSRIAAMAPLLGQAANRTAPTVEINGPQGPGTYERRPDGTLGFIGGRMPLQEQPETFSNPVEGMVGGQPAMVQYGNRGTVRPVANVSPPRQGPFAGTGTEQSALRVVLDPSADPATPTYAAAFQQLYGPRIVTQPDGTVVTMQPAPPAGVRPPVVAGAPSQEPAAASPTAAQAATLGQMPQPTTVTQTPAGTVTRQPGMGGTPTEDERRNSGYASRMLEAEQMMTRQVEGGYTPGNLRDAVTSRAGMAGNYVISGQGQLFRNAAEAWVRAKLRRESGAVIGEGEMAREITTYFPQPGDSPETIAQKAELRRIAVEELRTGAGRAVPPAPGIQATPPAAGQGGWSIRPVQ